MGMTQDGGVSRKMTAVEVAHDGRKRVDAVIQFVEIIMKDKDFVPESAVREWSLSRTKLQEAKMWLGKALEALGSELPSQYRDTADGGSNHFSDEANSEDEQSEPSGEATDSQGEEAIKPAKPEGKRVVRTRGSGDRVYMLDENKKSRQWVYNPEVLGSLGFEMSDVTEVEDNELLKYAMGPAILKAVERDDAGTQA